MKKETVIAIVLGVIIGMLIAVVILVKNREYQLTKTKTISHNPNQNNRPRNSLAKIQPLEISEPKDQAVFDSYTIKIKGKAAKDSLIIIQSPVKDLIFTNEKEEFSVQFPLSLGENVIKVTTHAKNSLVRSQEKELRIYNLNEEL
ncbi:hypothetical protein A2774_03710 [Candidatus Roizmanbacteria bacterium RIFCSPHIGHO2_01_FULL_39_12c]|uniref:Uncharacterized protein n=1 Tax=Candidatus Roizmanbacteria bacterium RIFCSPHIGHO2_01_FULL_39_12c TaxID=1802031 RepID=A0A1F7GEI7_9BACT|nr:MAG: hypothetical protein A2774_03710 [Candidatus Roizmanbacteria bacterium RIFCSPHIGHO2_01_FULL_39_12c]OGK47985.1 MAG: hypothetical protein A2963_00140 [Candidatus Roizmanbacteria bacterium RIFCSPLOWO2_01_FULL_40_13]